eukprot:3309077-Amphidinium_carterae.1
MPRSLFRVALASAFGAISQLSPHNVSSSSFVGAASLGTMRPKPFSLSGKQTRAEKRSQNFETTATAASLRAHAVRAS